MNSRKPLLAAAVLAALAAAFVASAAERSSGVPKLSDGQPDLQGYWTNNTVVPLERPAALGDRTEYTEEEAKKLTGERLVVEETEAGTDADVHYQLTDFGLDISQNTVVFNKHTSLITDPPNGRFPPVRADAAAAGKEAAARQRDHAFDAAETRSLTERCIIWAHQGPPIIPVGYNSNLEIFQGKGYVMIVTEMMPDPRIVPLDGRPHLSGAMKQWLGDSRGKWEGDTLVVETTNFTGRTAARGGGAGVMLSTKARVTERFQRLDKDTIRYQFTVEDPTVWDRSWTAEYPMKKIEGPMFEYACQEGNYGMANVLSGARAKERDAAAAGAGAGAAKKP